MKITQPKQASLFALNSTASGTSYDNSTSGLTADDVQEAIDEIVSGSLGAYLTVIGGGKGTVQSLGNLGATETLDLANANLFVGTLNANCTIGTTGWTNGKDCQITVIVFEDGTGGWTPTFSGVTWDGDTPTHDTTAGTFTRYVFTSYDGGTTIIGVQTGSGALSADLLALTAKSFGYSAHGNMGATETFDAATAWHSGTFNANCTFTLTPDATDTSSLFLELAQDGTGGWTMTLPASVANKAALEAAQDTTAGTTSFLVLLSRNNGTTWWGGWWGGGTTSPLTTKGDLWGYDTADARVPVGSNGEFLRADSTDAQGVAWQTADLDDLSDVTITAPATAQRLRYNGSAWVNSALKWSPTTTFDGTNWLMVVDGSGNPVLTEV